jgi:hypothetical protein
MRSAAPHCDNHVAKEVVVSLKLLSMLVAIGLAVVGAGCGGSSSEKKANEAYANGVCTAISTWTSEIQSMATPFRPRLSKASLQKKLARFQTTTKNLVAEIRAVPPPNTSEGQNAKKQVSHLVTQAQATTTAVRAAAAKIPAKASPSQIASALSALPPKLRDLSSAVQSTVSSLKQAGGSLSSAFDGAPACKKLSG